MSVTSIAVLGKGAFGKAVAHILTENGYVPECVDKGDLVSGAKEVVFLALPAQYIRSAVHEYTAVFSDDTLVVNCAKGIESESGKLPCEIVSEELGGVRYAVLSGPSFASEIVADIPTVVDIAVQSERDKKLLRTLLQNERFVVEVLDDVLELELAGAMKNVYAIAAGYIAGSGGGENTRAHMQVVALREYTKLIHILERNNDVIRPSVVGDLILTCASKESRNYQYGLALAGKASMPAATTEGRFAVEGLMKRLGTLAITLPLVQAVHMLVTNDVHAHKELYRALGFDKVEKL